MINFKTKRTIIIVIDSYFFLEIKSNIIITVFKETDFKIIYKKLKKYKCPYKIKNKNTIECSWVK